jgi:hypothetical protein
MNNNAAAVHDLGEIPCRFEPIVCPPMNILRIDRSIPLREMAHLAGVNVDERILKCVQSIGDGMDTWEWKLFCFGSICPTEGRTRIRLEDSGIWIPAPPECALAFAGQTPYDGQSRTIITAGDDDLMVTYPPRPTFTEEKEDLDPEACVAALIEGGSIRRCELIPSRLKVPHDATFLGVRKVPSLH